MDIASDAVTVRLLDGSETVGRDLPDGSTEWQDLSHADIIDSHGDRIDGFAFPASESWEEHVYDAALAEAGYTRTSPWAADRCTARATT